MTASATPTPIPACAPVLKLLDEACEVATGVLVDADGEAKAVP